MLLVFCLIFVSSNNASAKNGYNANYEVLDHRISGTPVFCALEPQKDPILPESIVSTLMKETSASVDAWIGALSGSKHAKWNINFVLIPRDKQNSYDQSKCDVIISFQKSPPASKENQVEVLGLYHRENNRGFIEIFYQAIGTCEKREVTGPNEITVWTYDCRQESIAPIEIIGATIRHEIGHALGLGHYQSQEISYMYLNTFNPSIMTPLSAKMEGLNALSNPKNAMIMPVDIQKLKDMYGENGWGTQTVKQTPEKKNVVSKSITKAKIIQITHGKTSIEKVSGSVPMEIYRSGMAADVIIIKPDGNTEKQRIGVGSNGKFEHSFVISDKIALGKYTITVSYFGKEVKTFAYEIR